MGSMDELINPTVITQLRTSLHDVAPGNRLDHLKDSAGLVGGMRLRDRVDIVRNALLKDLPADFTSTRTIIHEALSDPLFTGWMIWPVSELVTAKAIDSGAIEDFDAAMETLALLTHRLTCEFSIRAMIIARPERALQHAQDWTQHENEHVRRLATEGTRLYLPWAKRVPWLVANPRETRAILDASYRDPAEYVRRSVANHLNDLSRADQEALIETATAWAGNADENTAWVLRHGLRTLTKQGHPEALSLLGFSGDHLSISAPLLASDRIAWNGEIAFTTQVTNHSGTEANVAIDYSVGFLRANGSHGAKTFKLATRKIGPGETVTLGKTHSFRPITTRKYYPGVHTVTAQANGKKSEQTDFALEAESVEISRAK